MNDITTGLMQPDTHDPLTHFRTAIFGTLESKTLSELLEGLTPEDAQKVISMARITHLMASMQVRAKGYSEQTYAELSETLQRSYRKDLQHIVALLLEKLAPIEVRKQPKPDKEASGLALYNKWDAELEKAQSASPTAVSQPEQLSLLDKLEQSESSGKSDAEITIKDGRRFVGKLQFGDARLKDCKQSTGRTFTQDEFKGDTALQDAVAEWHFKDLDKAIDALGVNTEGYDREGLRAVAHLGGKTGMRKFVQSNGEYNPEDELGTSLKEYYDKFSSSKDV